MNDDAHTLRIAHLSDPHFSHITYSPKQFLSKRWIGNLNLLTFRRHSYQTAHLGHLPELLERLDVEHVCLTGDFSSTSLDSEFAEARAFVAEFRMPVHVLPGNHDAYTKNAEKAQRFYHHFPSGAMKKERVEKVELGKGWWYIGLDCALATPPLCAFGHFTPEMEEPLTRALEEIPQGDRVILANHFPLIHYKHRRPMHDLKGSDRLRALLKRYPQVKLYHHGHDHSHYIIDKRDEGLPLILNSGSCAHSPGGTFHLIDLHPDQCLIQQFLYKKERQGSSWVTHWEKNFKFS